MVNENVQAKTYLGSLKEVNCFLTLFLLQQKFHQGCHLLRKQRPSHIKSLILCTSNLRICFLLTFLLLPFCYKRDFHLLMYSSGRKNLPLILPVLLPTSTDGAAISLSFLNVFTCSISTVITLVRSALLSYLGQCNSFLTSICFPYQASSNLFST